MFEHSHLTGTGVNKDRYDSLYVEGERAAQLARKSTVITIKRFLETAAAKRIASMKGA